MHAAASQRGCEATGVRGEGAGGARALVAKCCTTYSSTPHKSLLPGSSRAGGSACALLNQPATVACNWVAGRSGGADAASRMATVEKGGAL